MRRKFIKQDSQEHYLTNFVPEYPEDGAPNLSTAFEAVESGTTEIVVQKAVINAINRSGICPGFKAVECHNRPDVDDKTRQKPDAGLYLLQDAPVDGRPNWDKQRLHFEFKSSTKVDPFEDNGKHFEPMADERVKSRGQVISYAEMMFLRQHLCFCFSVIIMGNQARIIRWDRSGAVVTKRFDYTKTDHLARFLWRFAHLSAEQQGFDPTATRVDADSPDGQRMLGHAEPVDGERRSYIREYFKQSLDRSYPWWRLKVEVTPENTQPPGKASGHDTNAEGAHSGAYFDVSSSAPPTKVMGEYLVGKPHFAARGLAGRGTRGYVALDCAANRLIWLKDAWRVDHDGIKKEGDTLQGLNRLGVENIPTYVTDGDILGQRTLSQTCWKAHSQAPNRECPLKGHVHYRLVVEEVCRPLRDFDSGPEFLTLIWDCIQVHRTVYERAKLLHRDISAGNMLIYEVEVEGQDGAVQMERRGFLCDWELSKPLANDTGPRQPDRTGTWQFLSVHALDDPTRTITIQDELESFVHVIIYYAVRWLRHSKIDVGSFINKFFDGDTWDGVKGAYKASESKRAVITSGQLQFGGEFITFRFEESAQKLKNEDGETKEQRDESAQSDSVTMKDGQRDANASSHSTAQSHPLDQALDIILGWFSAYYRLALLRKAAQPVSKPASTTYPPPRRMMKLLPADGVFRPSPQQVAQDLKQAEEAAKNLESHERLSEAIASAVSAHWPDSCKVNDQLPRNWRANKETPAESSKATGSSRKRSQLDDNDEGDSGSNKRAHISSGAQ